MTGANIIAKARQFVGYNSSTFTKAYGVSASTAWCCIFVWYIFRACGVSNLFYGGGKTAYVPTAQQWLASHCTKVSMVNARAGDVVIFTWGNNSRDHIGFVISGGSVLTTIEGNTSGSQVAIRTRYAANVYGIYRPNYTGSTPTTPTVSELSVDGSWGKDTTRKSQRVFGTTQDGIVSNQPYANRRYVPNASSASWQFTSNYGGDSSLIRAIQRMVGATPDDGVADKL